MPGTAECTATGCTFNSYGDSAAGWLINGSVSRSRDTTTFDITYDVTTTGASVQWALDGSVTITATSIDGDVHGHGVTKVEGGSNNPGVNVTWDTAVDYVRAARGAARCMRWCRTR